MVPKVSAERIGEEIVRLMTEGGAARGLDIMVETGLMKEVLPEVLPMIGCEQPVNYHPEGDVYVHTKIAVAMLSPGCTESLAFGMLFHDIAKPQTRAEQNGKVTYYGHTEIGARDGDRHPHATAPLARGAGTRRLPGEKSFEADDGAADAHLDAQADAHAKRASTSCSKSAGWTRSPRARTSASTTSAATRWRR